MRSPYLPRSLRKARPATLFGNTRRPCGACATGAITSTSQSALRKFLMNWVQRRWGGLCSGEYECVSKSTRTVFPPKNSAHTYAETKLPAKSTLEFLQLGRNVGWGTAQLPVVEGSKSQQQNYHPTANHPIRRGKALVCCGLFGGNRCSARAGSCGGGRRGAGRCRGCCGWSGRRRRRCLRGRRRRRRAGLFICRQRSHQPCRRVPPKVRVEHASTVYEIPTSALDQPASARVDQETRAGINGVTGGRVNRGGGRRGCGRGCGCRLRGWRGLWGWRGLRSWSRSRSGFRSGCRSGLRDGNWDRIRRNGSGRGRGFGSWRRRLHRKYRAGSHRCEESCGHGSGSRPAHKCPNIHVIVPHC